MNLIANLFYTYPFISVSLVLSTIWKLWPLLQSRRSIWTGKELNWIEKVIFCGVADFAKVWHGYEIYGLDELVKNKSNCLLIGYHSRPTLDIIYLTCTIQCHVLVTHLLFYIPILGSLLPLLGIIPSKGGVKDDAETTFIEALSKGDRPMMLLPGGTVECMKAYHDRYRVLWKENPGFARVVHAVPSLRANTKVVPFYTKNCERSMWTNAWWYTQSGRGVRFLMERFSKGGLASLPLMMITLLCSLGFFPLPAPVRMATYFGPQLTIKEDESPQEFAKRVKIELHELIDRVNGMPHTPRQRNSTLFMIFLGLFTFIQNIVMHGIGIAVLLILFYPLMLVAQMVLHFIRMMRPSKKEKKVE